MGGGLMQLVAYGAQDVYLTGQPQVTFFKVVYRRHTNFAVEPIKQTFNGSPGNGRTVSCNINRNGDLITNMYVVLTVDQDTSGGSGYVGENLVENVKIEIGGSKIDEHSKDWRRIHNSLTQEANHKTGYDTMVGNNLEIGTGKVLYIPLRFWFNRNAGLALPLIALQYHDVRVTVELGTIVNSTIKDASLLIDYVYLDSEERRRFAQASHEYLIEQVQFTGSESISSQKAKARLNFNHPCKYLAWSAGSGNTLTNASLQLNGHERFDTLDGTYFSKVQPYQHFSNTPESDINVYSFALKPEEHQPSGTCNFSRIDNATLNMEFSSGSEVSVFAVNYNVLRIMSGMGGLAYSN